MVHEMQLPTGMKTARALALLAVPALLLGGCATTTYETRTFGEAPYGEGWARHGHVESIRENVRTTQGNPAAGAFAGAVIGGLLLGGQSPVQTLAGMVGGAAVGAAASQAQNAEDRYFEVYVRFDDGGLEAYEYENVLPFRVSDRVVLTAQGLSRE